MKTIQDSKKCNVFKMNKFKLVLLVMMAVCSLHPSFAQTQPQTPESRKEAELKRLETALVTAKSGLNLAEKRGATADSLLNVGPELIAQGKAAQKQIGAQINALEKEYKSKVKLLDKQVNSKNKTEATEARKERKNVDTQYRSDLKDLTTKQRDALKKITTGENNKNKGKALQKTSRESVKRAQTNLEAAQARLDAAKGGDKSGKSKKKR